MVLGSSTEEAVMLLLAGTMSEESRLVFPTNNNQPQTSKPGKNE